MDQVYPMPSPQPNPDVVRLHQRINNEALLGVAQAIQQSVQDRQHANSTDLALVTGKLAKTVRGLQANSTKLLRPVVSALQGTVQAAQGVNASALAALPPSVVSTAKAVPAASRPATTTVSSGVNDWAVWQNTATKRYMAQEGVDVSLEGQGWILTAYGLSQDYANQLVNEFNGPITPPPLPPLPPPPTPPPLQGAGWYCAIQQAGGKELCAYYFSAEQVAIIQQTGTFQLISGPYATIEDATLACGLDASGCLPQVVTPPPQPPPQPPPIGQPPPPLQWYCYTHKLPDGTTENGVFSSAEVAAGSVAGWTLVAGPFATENDAEKVCLQPPPGFTPTVGCAANPMPALPNWCDVNVCQTVDAITGQTDGPRNFDVFRNLGLGTQAGINLTTGWLSSVGNLPVVGQGLQSLIIRVGCNLNNLVNSSITDMGSQLPAFLAVSVVRALVDFGERWFGLGLGDINTRLGYWLNYISPTHIPSVADADMLLQMGFINDTQWSCWVKANNTCPEPHKLVASAGAWHPTPFDTERLWRIGWLTDDDRDRMQKWNRMIDPLSIQTFSQAYEQYPPITDLIRFMVRDVWDPAVVDFGQLDKYFDVKWTADASKLGRISGIQDDIAKLYWRAHWVYPSAGQAFEMLHRLRPGKVDPALVFTQEDTAKLLGINDMAPGFIQRMVAISYRTLDLRAIRQMFATGQLSKEDVAGRLQDIGFTAEDAAKKADTEDVLRLRTLATQARGWTPAALSHAFASGIISDVVVKQQMLKLGYPIEFAQQLIEVAVLGRRAQFALRGERIAASRAQAATLTAYQVGAIPRDQALSVFLSQGLSAQSASILLDAQDLASRTQLVKQATVAVRRAFLQGVLSPLQVAAQLSAAGIAPPRADEYLATWTLQLSPKRRLLTRNQVLKLVREGILTAEQATIRLQNLGFGSDDVHLMILEVAYERNQAELRVNSSLDKQRQKAAAALLRESQRLQTLASKIRVNLCKKTPLATLRRWYAGHVVDDQYVIDSLTCQGYPSDAIAKYLTEFKATRYERDQKKATIPQEATAESNPPGTGSGSSGPAGSG